MRFNEREIYRDNAAARLLCSQILQDQKPTMNDLVQGAFMELEKFLLVQAELLEKKGSLIDGGLDYEDAGQEVLQVLLLPVSPTPSYLASVDSVYSSESGSLSDAQFRAYARRKALLDGTAHMKKIKLARTKANPAGWVENWGYCRCSKPLGKQTFAPSSHAVSLRHKRIRQNKWFKNSDVWRIYQAKGSGISGLSKSCQ